MRRSIVAFAAALFLASGLGAQSTPPRGGSASITPAALQEWLGYVASDDLQGRALFSEGLDQAGSYIAEHLEAWGVKPGGEGGSYFQAVKIVGSKTGEGASVERDAADPTSGTRFTRNVVGIVPGSDPALKDTYILFGAHYDHIGRTTDGSSVAKADLGDHPGRCPGQAPPTPRPGDTIYNGADDDGSGTVALMALARAFAAGPRPKRSLVFVWHSGEETGLYGSRYYADYPVVPIDQTVAELNIDMIGRNRCDLASEENTVYVVGADRISTELHNLNEDANAGLTKPMTLDYEYNDPADGEQLYTRSDHYSYASKGIPIIFYTTGLHRDYHSVTDEVEKIDFPKLAHVTELVYATAMKVGNLDHAPVRDNKGPRKGKGSSGRIEK